MRAPDWLLYGRTFGTLPALILMRAVPAPVRSVILDGVWPPQVNVAEADMRTRLPRLRRCSAAAKRTRIAPGAILI